MKAPSFNQNTYCLEVFNRLLRGELSAVETYSQAIGKFSYEPGLDPLIQIREDHVKSADSLKSEIMRMGGLPDMDSGAWGKFVQAVQAAANLFGENSAVNSLQSGERHGVNEYQQALDDEGVFPEYKDLIRTELLPRGNAHIDTLERIGH